MIEAGDTRLVGLGRILLHLGLGDGTLNSARLKRAAAPIRTAGVMAARLTQLRVASSGILLAVIVWLRANAVSTIVDIRVALKAQVESIHEPASGELLRWPGGLAHKKFSAVTGIALMSPLQSICRSWRRETIYNSFDDLADAHSP